MERNPWEKKRLWKLTGNFQSAFFAREKFQIRRTQNGVSRHFAKENDRNVLQTTDWFFASQFSLSQSAYQQLNKHINKKNQSNKNRKQVSPGITSPTTPKKKIQNTHCHSFQQK